MTILRRVFLVMAAGLVLPALTQAQRPLPVAPMPGPPRSMARQLGPAPASLQISFADPGVLLTWQGVDAPAGYRVYRTADPAVPPTELTTAAIPEPKFLDLAVAPGGVYYYSVAADYADTRLGTTQPVAFGVPIASRSGGLVKPPITSAPTNLPASAPTGLTASATPISVTLNWNTGFGAQYYEVSRVAPNGQATLLTQPQFPLTATTLTDRGVQPGVSYRYDVSAVGGRGDRATASKSVIPPNPVNPAGLTSTIQLNNIQSQVTPTLNVQVTVNGTVNLSWQPVPGATSYRVAGPNISQYRQVMGTGTVIYQVPPGTAQYTVVADFTNGQGQRFGLDQAPAKLAVQVGSLQVQGFGTSQPGGGLFTWYDQTGATGFHLMIADRPEGPYVESTDAIGPTWGYHRQPEAWPGRAYWYKVISTFPNAPAAITDPPLLVCKNGGQNLTGLEVVSNQAGAVKIRWHPICYAWYHVYTPTTNVIIPAENWIKSEFTDAATVSGKSYMYNVCSQRIEGPGVTDVCGQITVAVP